MLVTPIPCLKDNYAYLVVCEETGEAAIVDPSEAAPVALVVDASKASKGKLSAIWNTHHHFDHVGGNEEIVKKYGVKTVCGHVSDDGRIPGQTRRLNEGDRFSFGVLDVTILHIPGHTLGAIAYVVRAPGEAPVVFTGDTLFLAGCGRLFEGTPAQMHASLQALAACGPGARVYCGHEYTQQNLRFAKHVEPANAAVDAASERARALRAEGKPTVPTLIEDELATNPFLRVRSKEIRATLGIADGADDAAALGAIRAAKDGFKG
jgi:hydroxyacylglutathione hydrolase